MKHDLLPTGLTTRPKARGGAGAIVLAGTIAALYFTREILIPFAFALTLTFLLTPVVALLQRLRIGRVMSVVVTVLVSIAVAGGVAWIIANQLVDVANQPTPSVSPEYPFQDRSVSHPDDGPAGPGYGKRAGDRAGTQRPGRASPGRSSAGPEAA
jgi:hypothetical protein